MPFIQLVQRDGFLTKVHNYIRSGFILTLENSSGIRYPVYEGHNYVPCGHYQIVEIRPFKLGDKSIHYPFLGCNIFATGREDDMIFIIDEGPLGGYTNLCGEAWNKYLSEHEDELTIPGYWFERAAMQLISAANKYVEGWCSNET